MSTNDTKKYHQSCTEFEKNKHYCFLNIKSFGKKDVGEYLVIGKLKDHPDKIFKRYIHITKPSILVNFLYYDCKILVFNCFI